MNNLNLKEEKEIEEILSRYTRRENISPDKYSLLNPYVYLSEQEKERAIIKCFAKNNLDDFSNKTILEVGCGNGNNLLFFLKLGFSQGNIYANDLIEKRIKKARSILPSEVHFYQGDARFLDLQDNYFDIVFQSVVFTSIKETGFKVELANKMWRLLKPGGAILWIDFIYDNPFNSDVKGVPFKEIKNLFPEANIHKWKIILAPPVGRMVTKISPAFYHTFNYFHFLRSHLLCWIEKKIE